MDFKGLQNKKIVQNTKVYLVPDKKVREEKIFDSNFYKTSNTLEILEDKNQNFILINGDSI